MSAECGEARGSPAFEGLCWQGWVVSDGGEKLQERMKRFGLGIIRLAEKMLGVRPPGLSLTSSSSPELLLVPTIEPRVARGQGLISSSLPFSRHCSGAWNFGVVRTLEPERGASLGH